MATQDMLLENTCLQTLRGLGTCPNVLNSRNKNNQSKAFLNPFPGPEYVCNCHLRWPCACSQLTLCYDHKQIAYTKKGCGFSDTIPGVSGKGWGEGAALFCFLQTMESNGE